MDLFKNLIYDNINLQEVLKDQIKFKSDLREIKKTKSKSENQVSVIQNVEICFDLREKITVFFRDYSCLLSEAKYKIKYWKGHKLVTPKQMLQRLPTLLSEVKAGNLSGNLLNEIGQIIYSLHKSKEIIQTVHNNTMNSTKL